MLKDVKIAEEKFKFEWQQTVPHKFKNDKERAGNVHRLFMHMFCVKMIRVCQNLNFREYESGPAKFGKYYQFLNSFQKQYRKIFCI